MELPKRKSPRIPGYDYSNQNYYFITICTHNKRCIFGQPGSLNQYGRIAQEHLLKIPLLHPDICLDQYIVMPNHIHAIVALKRDHHSNLSTVIGQYKTSVTRKIRETEPDMLVWQRSFHDHVIRDQKSYEKIWNYVTFNPQKWEEDCFYCDTQ